MGRFIQTQAALSRLAVNKNTTSLPSSGECRYELAVSQKSAGNLADVFVQINPTRAIGIVFDTVQRPLLEDWRTVALRQ
ncbi:hypothetical protein AW878_14350 [Bordetella pseudohinzii]|uniref:Uncharacterized protein n=1 Tax=Bordetella pseudohinzii TaxID=1331258 RepID=A0ABM6DKQ2_9BORD|nr:hypothetical protein BBN53_20840 [Bordetella pseudohinzii]KXA77872.1 hypothetical protein AW878_14350 [Bordetella pseudohinzii]KXA78067.1 hypothetical protein AW877_12805 [Bordetella pseudohinzii]